MAHKSPFSKAIGDEWERLIDLQDWRDPTREPPTAQVEGWKRLYVRTMKDGLWVVSAPDASLIASLGTTIAFRQRRYVDAMRLARQYMDHPDAPLGDDVAWIEMSTDYGIALILAGRVEDGIGRLRVVLSEGAYPLKGRRNLVRNKLLFLLGEFGEDARSDMRVADFAAELLREWEGQRSKAPCAVACRANGELARLLMGTYPVHRPERPLE